MFTASVIYELRHVSKVACSSKRLYNRGLECSEHGEVFDQILKNGIPGAIEVACVRLFANMKESTDVKRRIR